MVAKDGYRFVQGLIPTKMHRDLTEVSRKMGQSRSETLRNAIEAFLKNKKCECSGDGRNEQNRNS